MMIKKNIKTSFNYLGILIFLFISHYASSQVKKIVFFDKEWNETTKDKAFYYRSLPLETKNNLILIKDYYISGKPQMIGWADKDNEDFLQGEVKWFYENGNLQILSNYRDGNLQGLRKEFYENGNVKLIVNYEDHSRDGEAHFFTESGKLSSTIIYKNRKPYEGTTQCFITYKNGIKIKEQLYYENSTQQAYEKEILGNEVKEIYYDKKGNKLREIKSNLQLKNQDGYKSSFYSGTYCGYVTSIKHSQKIKKGMLEGSEYFYNRDGSILYSGINKNNKPFQGTFVKKKRGLNYISKYDLGVKREEEIKLGNKTVGKGIYVKGKKHEGIFISEAEVHGWVCSKVSTFKNGKEEGKQIFKRLEDAKPLAYYYARNGVKEGENYDYDHKTKTSYILYYKKGVPFKGKLLDKDKTVFIYENGQLIRKKVRNKIRGIHFFEIYENDVKVGVEYSFYTINGKTKQEGSYRNDKPYQGYFLREGFEFAILDYYENGVKKYQYSKGLSGLKTEEELKEHFNQITIPFKSIYKDNKIYTGVEYTHIDSGYSTSILKKGEINAISLWVFAMHYGNNIIIKKTDEGMGVFEAQNTNLKIIVDKQNISLLYKGEVIDQRKRKGNSLVNQQVVFYLDKGILKKKITWRLSKKAVDKMSKLNYRESRNDFLVKIYLQLPLKNTVKSTFLKFKGTGVKPDGIDYITQIRYNEQGKPFEGFLIEEKNNAFNLKLYLESKLKKSKEKLTIEEVKELIKIWYKENQ